MYQKKTSGRDIAVYSAEKTTLLCCINALFCIHKAKEHIADKLWFARDAILWIFVVRRHRLYGIEVKKSDIDGFGVFATRGFIKDELIGVMKGSVLEHDHLETRYTCYFPGGTTEEHYWMFEPGWPFRFLNHAKEPNATLEDPCIVATRKIGRGEEITVDYGEDW